MALSDVPTTKYLVTFYSDIHKMVLHYLLERIIFHAIRFPGGWIEFGTFNGDYTQNGVTLSDWAKNIPCNLDLFSAWWIELWTSYSDLTQNGVTLSAWGNNIPFNIDFLPGESKFERYTAILPKMVLYCLLERRIFHAIYFVLPDESNFEQFTVTIHKMALHCLLEWIIFHAI